MFLKRIFSLKLSLIIFCISFHCIFLSGQLQAMEFDPFGIQPSNWSLEKHFSEKQSPNVILDRKCEGSGENKKCWSVLKNGDEEIIKSFDRSSNLSVLTSVRYQNKAYIMVRHRYRCGDIRCSEKLIFDSNGNVEQVIGGGDYQGAKALQITKDKKILKLNTHELTKWTVDGNREETYRIPTKGNRPRLIKTGLIQNNSEGRQVAVALIRLENRNFSQIWVFDGEKWKNTQKKTRNSSFNYSFKNRMLAAYPLSNKDLGVVFYRYLNVFNKGVFILIVDDSGIRKYPVFVSADRNVGFDPQFFLSDKTLNIIVLDSTNSQRMKINIPIEKIYDEQMPSFENLGKFPETQKDNYVYLGRGFMWRFWKVSSESEKVKVDYQVDPALMTEDSFQADMGDINFSLKYRRLFNSEKASNRFGKDKRVKDRFYRGSIKVNNLFSNFSGLRLDYEHHSIDGLADIQYAGVPDTSASFSYRHSKIGVHRTYKSGFSLGIEYSDYQMPAVVKFQDKNEAIVYSDFDSEFGLERLMLVVGYEEMFAAKDFETFFSDWYFDIQAKYGVGKVDISSETKNDAIKQTGINSFSSSGYFLYEVDIELGYVARLHSLKAGGIGLQFSTGYRGEYSAIHKKIDESTDFDMLHLHFDRSDLWHGPFIDFKIVF